jgi:hypothetical protein
MDLIVLLPPPLITLAVQVLKFLGMPSSAAPWVALAFAVIATIIIHVLGIEQGVLMSVVVFLVGWLGSMGTWEALKNLIMSRLNPPAPQG